MATTDKRLNVTELDFDDIKGNLKTFLRNQSDFTDYDFEGSGMSALLDVLAYNTHYLAMNMNMVANEIISRYCVCSFFRSFSRKDIRLYTKLCKSSYWNM